MIKIENMDNVAQWTLDHGKAHALDLELAEELTARFAEFESSPARALVITGRGRIFCAGVDLKRIVEGGAPYVKRFIPALNAAFLAAACATKPVVCAANGHAIAGGAVLFFSGDHRLVADGDLRLGLPEVVVGVPFPTVAVELVKQITSPGRLGPVMMQGQTYDPATAVDMGWAHERVNADNLLPLAMERAQQLCAMPAVTFRLLKRHLRHPLVSFVQGPGRDIDREVQTAWESPVVLDAVRAYVQRTLVR